MPSITIPGHGPSDTLESNPLPKLNRRDDLLSKERGDPVLDQKMKIINDAIDEIGFTSYHVKLFFLNGFGYAVDSLITVLQSIIAVQAAAEFHPSFKNGLTIAAYVGMLIGALFWGLSADVVGRRFAFNMSLLVSGIFTVAAGASPNWIVLGLFVSLATFGAGGNLVLDTTVFLEYLPSSKTWLITLMAAWWGVGQLVAGLLAWAFIPNNSCDPEALHCDPAKNRGWRYVWYTAGGMVLVMSMLRLSVLQLKETPKFLLSEGKDEEVVEMLNELAQQENRRCSLTLDQLDACNSASPQRDAASDADPGSPTEGDEQRGFLKRFDLSPKQWGSNASSVATDIIAHLKGLFRTRRIGRSTLLIWLSWALIGIAFPLYNIFLPTYLASRGAQFGETNPSITWRNYSIANVCGILGPIPAAFMSNSRFFWGRRGTMVIGALITCVFFFAYTQISSASQNLGFTCAINFALNIYYGTLFAYTPEVLPSAHRGTGNGIAIAANRIMGIVSAVIGTVADIKTSAPIFICAAAYIVLAFLAAMFPFEPFGRRSS